jgi:hypothetical protein
MFRLRHRKRESATVPPWPRGYSWRTRYDSHRGAHEHGACPDDRDPHCAARRHHKACRSDPGEGGHLARRADLAAKTTDRLTNHFGRPATPAAERKRSPSNKSCDICRPPRYTNSGGWRNPTLPQLCQNYWSLSVRISKFDRLGPPLNP